MQQHLLSLVFLIHGIQTFPSASQLPKKIHMEAQQNKHPLFPKHYYCRRLLDFCTGLIYSSWVHGALKKVSWKIQAMGRRNIHLYKLKPIHHCSQPKSKDKFSTENEATHSVLGNICWCTMFMRNAAELIPNHSTSCITTAEVIWCELLTLYEFQRLGREDDDSFPPRVWIIASRTFISLSRFAISCCFARNSSMCSSNTSALN